MQFFLTLFVVVAIGFIVNLLLLLLFNKFKDFLQYRLWHYSIEYIIYPAVGSVLAGLMCVSVFIFFISIVYCMVNYNTVTLSSLWNMWIN